MKVRLVSSRTRFDEKRALADIRETVRLAAQAGCDLVCYPEFTIGGLPSGDCAADIALAVSISGPFVAALRHLARVHRVYIAAGILEEDAGTLHDSAVLLGPAGELELHYRRISPTWKPHWARSDQYQDGSRYETAIVDGRVLGFALCGDIFYESILDRVRASSVDILVVPIFRSFDEDCESERAWHESEKYVYARQIAPLGIPAVVINAYNDQGVDTAFGGSLIVSTNGEILAEGEIGRPGVLLGEVPSAG